MISKIKILFILLFFLNSCVGLPGVDQEPKKRKLSKKLTSEYSIEDVEINIINLNKATEVDFGFFNQKWQKEPKRNLSLTILNFRLKKPNKLVFGHLEINVNFSDQNSYGSS